jgi:hypothetical protein
MKSPARDGRDVTVRKDLSSLTGLVDWRGRKPTAKAVGYFQSAVGAA